MSQRKVGHNFLVASGACILNSLIFPIPSSPEDDEGDSVIDSADARFAVMGIISFIPYSIELVICVVGYWEAALCCICYRVFGSLLELEASIKNGDIQGLQLFGEVGKHLTLNSRKDIRISEEEKGRKDHMNLPSAQEQARNYIRDWGVPRKPFQNSKSLNEEEGEADEGKQHKGIQNAFHEGKANDEIIFPVCILFL